MSKKSKELNTVAARTQVPLAPIAKQPGTGHLDISTTISGTPFTDPTENDFRILVSEINPDGPVILVYKYLQKEVPVTDEFFAMFLMRCLMRERTEFRVNDEYHIRVAIRRPAEVSDGVQ